MLQVCVCVCTAACRSFPIEHAYAHGVTHTRYESVEPALLLPRPFPRSLTDDSGTIIMSSFGQIEHTTVLPRLQQATYAAGQHIPVSVAGPTWALLTYFLVCFHCQPTLNYTVVTY